MFIAPAGVVAPICHRSEGQIHEQTSRCLRRHVPPLYRSARLCFLLRVRLFDMTPCRICRLVLRSIKLSYTAAFRNPVRRIAGWNQVVVLHVAVANRIGDFFAVHHGVSLFQAR